MKSSGLVGAGAYRGFALIEILLVIAIIALLVAGYHGLSSRDGAEDEGPQTTPGRAIQKAESVECAANLKQLRMLIEMHVIEHGEYPRQFTPGDQGTMGRCPVSNEAYRYDPQTGRIHCTTRGHESL